MRPCFAAGLDARKAVRTIRRPLMSWRPEKAAAISLVAQCSGAGM